MNHTCGSAPGTPWKAVQRLPDLLRQEIAVVPAEQFIATIAGQADCHLTARQL